MHALETFCAKKGKYETVEYGNHRILIKEIDIRIIRIHKHANSAYSTQRTNNNISEIKINNKRNFGAKNVSMLP